MLDITPLIVRVANSIVYGARTETKRDLIGVESNPCGGMEFKRVSIAWAYLKTAY
jgi:hypothetical protein